jgi:hypothetical protein
MSNRVIATAIAVPPSPRDCESRRVEPRRFTYESTIGAVGISILWRWLPNGRLIGNEYEALNPRRSDRRPGSFKINIRTGQWSDFATGDKGGDIISLAAYIFNLTQFQAASKLAQMLGLTSKSI